MPPEYLSASYDAGEELHRPEAAEVQKNPRVLYVNDLSGPHSLRNALRKARKTLPPGENTVKVMLPVDKVSLPLVILRINDPEILVDWHIENPFLPGPRQKFHVILFKFIIRPQEFPAVTRAVTGTASKPHTPENFHGSGTDLSGIEKLQFPLRLRLKLAARILRSIIF